MRPFRTIIHALTIVIAAVMVLAFAKAPALSSGGQQSCTTPDSYPLPDGFDSSDVVARDGDIALIQILATDDLRLTDDMDYKDAYILRRYVRGRLTDSATVACPSPRLSGEKNLCHVINGVDTITLDIRRPLPAVIDSRSHEIIPGCRDYRLSRHFQESSEYSWPSDFQINISLPSDTPSFILDSISQGIRGNIADIFAEYEDGKTILPDIKLFKATASNIDKMMDYYYGQFCKLYREKGYDHYSYQLYIYPVWEDSAHHQMTWKFYTYTYMGGAHGAETEYYLTFDTRDKRLLGIRDFYTATQIPGVYEKLATLLNAYHGRTPLDNYYDCAYLDPESSVTAAASTTLNERYDGQVYPRPARTRQGIVFTYQTYEKGCNADGVLHFLIR